MNFQEYVDEIKELTFQELVDNNVEREEHFTDQIWIILHDQIDKQMKHLTLTGIDELLVDYGLNKALYIAMSDNALYSSPEYGEDIYSPSVLRSAIQDAMEKQDISWGEYQEYREENEEDEEPEETCDDCKEPFKTVGSLTIKMMFDDKMLCKDCCIKRCDAVDC